MTNRDEPVLTRTLVMSSADPLTQAPAKSDRTNGTRPNGVHPRQDLGPPQRSSVPAADVPCALAVVAAEASERDVRRLVERARAMGHDAWVYEVGPGVVVLPALPADELDRIIGSDAAVERLFVPDTRYRLVRREVWPLGLEVKVGGFPIGGERFAVIAGPCAVETRDHLLLTAEAVAAGGGNLLRGGVFKPRTSPYLFQGVGLAGLELLAEARQRFGLPFITEVMSPDQIEPMYAWVDAFQVGARNMQNYALLKALGDIDKPVILKRGPAATVEEWLLAAEYLLVGGNDQVVLCERGIRTFNTSTRFTLDLASVALVKRETHLPVIVDPSHATGDPVLVAPMARAALAAGADGVMVEVHHRPDAAWSDGYQALDPNEFAEMVSDLAAMAPLVGRRVAARATAGAAERGS